MCNFINISMASFFVIGCVNLAQAAAGRHPIRKLQHRRRSAFLIDSKAHGIHIPRRSRNGVMCPCVRRLRLTLSSAPGCPLVEQILKHFLRIPFTREQLLLAERRVDEAACGV